MTRRRFQWSCIALLCLATAVLVRPVRKWVDQWAVRHAVHSDMSVQALRIHPRESIVSIIGAEFTNQTSNRTLQVRADEVWLAVDGEQLLDRRFHFPAIVLRGAEFTLGEPQQQRVQAMEIWQEKLANKLVKLDWDALKDEFHSLVASDDIAKTWTERVGRWIVRSREIVLEADDLKSLSEEEANPLRLGDELTERMTQLNRLLTEQEAISNQFVSVEKLLFAESNRLLEMFDREDALISRIADTQLEDQELCQELALELLRSTAVQEWNKHAGYLELGDRVARAALLNQLGSQELELRRASESLPLTDITKLMASGKCILDDQQSDLSLLARIACWQSSDFRRKYSANWRFQFQPDSATDSQVIHLTIASQQNAPKVHELRLARVAMPANKPTPTIDQPELDLEDTIVDPTATIISDDDKICGTLILRGADIVASAQHVGVESAPELIDQQYQIEVTGTWGQPEFRCEPKSMTASLVEYVKSAVKAQIAESQRDLRYQLLDRFEGRIAALQQVIDQVVAGGSKQVQLDAQELISAREFLLQKEQQLNSGIFAGRPANSIQR